MAKSWGVKESPSLRRLLTLGLVAFLLAGLILVPKAVAQDQVDEAEEEDVDVVEEVTRDFEDEDGGGTEVVASGEDVEEAEEELQLEPARGVETRAIFPAFLTKTPTFRAGQQAEMLFGIANDASAPLKIQGILGKLYVPYDSRIVAQNFTGELPSNITLINATVPRGSQSTFAFHFTPFRMLQPMTFGLSATLLYEVDGTLHASVLFNSTLEVIEPSGVISGETVFLVLLAAGALVLLGMWVSSQLDSFSKSAKRSKKVETGTGDDSSAANNEWLQGTFFNANQGKAGQGPKQRRRR